MMFKQAADDQNLGYIPDNITYIVSKYHLRNPEVEKTWRFYIFFTSIVALKWKTIILNRTIHQAQNIEPMAAIGIIGCRAGEPNIVGWDIGMDMTSQKGCAAIGCGCCVIGWDCLAGEPPSDIRITSSRSSNADLGCGGLAGGGGRAGDADMGWVGSPIPMNGFAAAACRKDFKHFT